MNANPTKESVSLIRLIRNRLIAGLFVLLPLYITYAVLSWLYVSLDSIALQPISNWLRMVWKLEDEEPSWVLTISLTLAALFVIGAVVYVAGMLFRSRLHRTVNWVLLNVPLVNTIYSAVIKVFDAISGSHTGASQFKRVVLVPFPSESMKAPAFVTGECRDQATGRTILAVYVPTTPVPTSGYMLLIPQEDVIELDWDLEETLQAIVSGGITVPDRVTYDRPPPIAGGPTFGLATKIEPES